MLDQGGVVADRPRLLSHVCGLSDLVADFVLAEEERGLLRLDAGWPHRWTVSVRTGEGCEAVPVAELSGAWMSGLRPVRRFGWTTRQRHRPGLQYLVSTGRHHGFESLAEQRLLLVLDFLGVDDVLGQPFELRAATPDGWVRHVPDFLVSGRDGLWLVDVRPAGRVEAGDRLRFAATAEVALVFGWGFAVVTGWKPGVTAAVDALSAQRRPLSDPLGLQPQLLAGAAGGPSRFGELVAATSAPVVARAHAMHLIWRRLLGVDLSVPIGDETVVWPVTAQRGR